MTSDNSRKTEPVERASRRLRNTAVVTFIVIEIFIIVSAVIEVVVSDHSILSAILIALLFSAFSIVVIFSSLRLATRSLEQASASEHARMLAESELKIVLENEHALLNAPVASSVLTETDGTVLAINESAAKMLGSAPDEIVGKPIIDLLPPDISQQQRELGRRVVRMDEPLIVTGALLGRQYTEYLVPIRDEAGTVVRIAVLAVDVTDREDMHRRLKESERRYRTQFETSVDGILYTSLDGKILDCNESYARMLGYEVGELIGMNTWALTPEEWQPVDWDIIENQIVPTGHSDEYEKEYCRKDGSRIPVSLRIWAVYAEAGNMSGVWGRVEDLSQQKQYENFIRQTIIRLEQANERLREVDRLKTEFVGMVSHELRAPIAAMESGFSALNALGQNASAEQRAELLEVLERGTVRLRHLVDDLLDISRIESGQLKLELREIDAAELAGRVMDSYAQRCRDKGIELCFEHADGSGLVVCDPRRVEQVLINLIDNAVKFTERGSVTVRLDSTPAVAIFAVTDSGPGLPPSLHEQVFEKFFTSGAPDGQHGVGLGLAISRGIVEAHKGRMWVESRDGSGATFGFELPVLQDTSQTAP